MYKTCVDRRVILRDLYLDLEQMLLAIGAAPGTGEIQPRVQMKRSVGVPVDMAVLSTCPDLMIHVHVSGVMIDVIGVGLKSIRVADGLIGFFHRCDVRFLDRSGIQFLSGSGIHLLNRCTIRFFCRVERVIRD